MNWIALLSSATWVELIFMFIHKFVYPLSGSLSVWWSPLYGMTAVTSDVLILVLGIFLAKVLLPTWNLVLSSVTIQVIHDILFYLFVILQVPTGQNTVIDLFKKYTSGKNPGLIVVADSIMIGSTVVGMNYLEGLSNNMVIFLGLLAVYALTYLVYTK